MHLFSKNRLVVGVLAGLAVLAMACNTPSAIAVGKPLPADTMKLLAEKQGKSGIVNLKLTVAGHFRANGNFTVLTAESGQVAVDVKKIEHTANALANLAGGCPLATKPADGTCSVTLTRKGQSATLPASLRVRSATERMLTYIGTDNDFQFIRDDALVTPVTYVGDDGYVASFVPNTPVGKPFDIGSGIASSVRGTYVEICQNMVDVGLAAGGGAKLTSSAWKGQEAAAELALQEEFCQILGIAAMIANAGYSYPDYAAAMKKRVNDTRTIQNEVIIHLLPVDEKTYNSLKG